MEEIPDYSEEKEEPSQDALKRLNNLVIEMAKLVVQEENLEERLKEIKKERAKYEENLVPELMLSLGLSRIVTEAGIDVEVKTAMRANLPSDPEKREMAINWLKETGNDGIIKNQFKISFGRDASEWADEFAALLEKAQVGDRATIEHDLNIHHQTLLAFLREQRSLGVNVPMEAFGAFEQKFAKIKR